ncbi:hypothetical protein WH7805_10358 [Synechococcus sp. WH 7805]|nr:hypothetical protein WH7805_10358 [Synechococcus sp. WH 7805]
MEKQKTVAIVRGCRPGWQASRLRRAVEAINPA